MCSQFPAVYEQIWVPIYAINVETSSVHMGIIGSCKEACGVVLNHVQYRRGNPGTHWPDTYRSQSTGNGFQHHFLIIGNIKMHPQNALDFKWVCDTWLSDFRIPTDLLSLFRLSLFEYISESHISTALSSDFCVGHNELKYLAIANWISKCHELVPVDGHCLSVMPQVDWALLSLDVYPDGKTAGWSLCSWDGFI